MSIWDGLVADDDSRAEAACNCGEHWDGTGRDAAREVLEVAGTHAAVGHVVKVSVDNIGAGRIGQGGSGDDPGIPECPICHAHGGGGHGGLCPNAGRPPDQWQYPGIPHMRAEGGP